MNPCKDDSFVKIVPSDLAEIDYQLFTGQQSTKTEPFTLEINPEEHDLCGPLDYKAYYDGSVNPAD